MQKPLAVAIAAALSLSSLAAAADTVPVFKNFEEFDRCVRDNYNGDLCNDGLTALVKKKPALALAAGKRARLAFNAPTAVPYFAVALRGTNAKTKAALCDDRDFQLATAAGLALPPDYPVQATSAKLFDACYAALLPLVKTELASSAGGYLEGNVCKTLAARGDSSPTCAPKPVEAPVVTAAPAPLPKLDAASTQLDRVKVFKGPEGERVSIAMVKGQPDLAVVRFDNVAGPWNGQAYVHRVTTTRRGENVDFTTEHEGKPFNSVLKRDGGYECFVPGQPSFRVGYSDTDSAGANAQQLLKALR